MTFRTTTLLAAAFVAMAGAASAAPVTPIFGTFGDITDTGVSTEFGGDGIPTDATAYDTFTDRFGNVLTLGLSITPRFGAPKPANDGAGTFTVQPGIAGGGTLWNFSFYAGIEAALGSTITAADIGLELLYDLDQAEGTESADLGSIDLSSFAPSGAAFIEGSQNLSFGFLATGLPGVTPGLNTFSADVGAYSFLLRANDFSAEATNGVAVLAEVAPVPLPAALPLLLAGLGGLSLMRRRKKTAA